jgi:hypothetical protein
MWGFFYVHRIWVQGPGENLIGNVLHVVVVHWCANQNVSDATG